MVNNTYSTGLCTVAACGSFFLVKCPIVSITVRGEIGLASGVFVTFKRRPRGVSRLQEFRRLVHFHIFRASSVSHALHPHLHLLTLPSSLNHSKKVSKIIEPFFGNFQQLF